MATKYTKRQLQIIHSAVELIASKGMSHLTMNHIASQIEVTEPALYRHFKSKKEILKGVLNLIAQIDLTPHELEKTGLDLIECIMQKRIDSFTGKPALAAIIFSEEIFSGDNDLSQRIKLLMQETQQKIIHIIQLSQAQGSMRSDLQPEQIALLIIGSFRFLVTQWHLLENDFNLQERATTLFQDFRLLFRAE